MTVGLTVEKANIDSNVGTLARDLNEMMGKLESIGNYFADKNQSDLEALGYSADEAYLLLLWSQDMLQFKQVFEGAVSLATAKDFRALSRKLWGLGFE